MIDFSKKQNRQIRQKTSYQNTDGDIRQPVDTEINPGKRHQKNHKNTDDIEQNPPKSAQIIVENINQHYKKNCGDHGVVAGKTRTENVGNYSVGWAVHIEK